MTIFNIGEKIKCARISRGFSQEKLAKIIGVTKATISRYENGEREPRLDQLQKIAEALHLPLYDLFGKILFSDSLNEGVLSAEDLAKEMDIPIEAVEELLYNPKYKNTETYKKVEIIGSALAIAFDDNKQRKNKKQMEARQRKHIISKAFEKLNEQGQLKAIDRLEELTEIPKYQRKEIPEE